MVLLAVGQSPCVLLPSLASGSARTGPGQHLIVPDEASFNLTDHGRVGEHEHCTLRARGPRQRPPLACCWAARCAEQLLLQPPPAPGVIF